MTDTTTSTSNDVLTIGKTVFIRFVEEHWDKQYVRKSHHEPETRSVFLQGKIIDVQGDKFSAELFGNNGFERDGGIFCFHKNSLLCNQNFTDTASLGQWRQNPSNNP